jgi:2,3-bisphosphoglycerate-independent phosphoglycerate mutase
MAANHLKQLRTAETEKYAHVTFFFNGGVEKPNEGEDRCLSFEPEGGDLRPAARDERTGSDRQTLRSASDSGKYDVIILNFANCDMVGHTGVFDAAVKRPWRPSTPAWAVSSTLCCARAGCADNRRPRQRRQDEGA